MDNQLLQLNAFQLSELYARKALSPVELAQELHQAIEYWQPLAHPFAYYRAEELFEQAAAAEKRWLQQRPQSRLDGVPFSLKEALVSDSALSLKERIARSVQQTQQKNLGHPAVEKNKILARLLGSGALLFAETTSSELGMIASGLSSKHGVIRNPHNLEWSSGGSSSGAAVAAAAGLASLHLASDICGSIRIPAAHCGVYGFKPARFSPQDLSEALCFGAIARSLIDIELFATDILQQKIATKKNWSACVIGVMTEADKRLACHPAQQESCIAAAMLLKASGVQIVELDPLFESSMLDGFGRCLQLRQQKILGKMSFEERSKLHPYVENWAAAVQKLNAAELVNASKELQRLARTCHEIFEKVDFVLSPTLPYLCFKAEEALPPGVADPAMSHVYFVAPWSIGGQACLTLAHGHAENGAPLSLQFIAPYQRQYQLLPLASYYQRISAGKESSIVLRPTVNA